MKKSIILSLLLSQISFFILMPVWMKLTRYLHPLVLAIVWLGFSSLVLLSVCWIRKTKILLPKSIIHSLAFIYAIGLLILLFFRPNNQSYESMNLIPFHTIEFYLSGKVAFLIAFYNLGANIFLFIPFGLYYQYVRKDKSVGQLFFIAIICISMIEFLQFFTKRGCLDIDDLILNVLGVCMGYFIQPLFQKIINVKENE